MIDIKKLDKFIQSYSENIDIYWYSDIFLHEVINLRFTKKIYMQFIDCLLSKLKENKLEKDTYINFLFPIDKNVNLESISFRDLKMDINLDLNPEIRLCSNYILKSSYINLITELWYNKIENIPSFLPKRYWSIDYLEEHHFEWMREKNAVLRTIIFPPENKNFFISKTWFNVDFAIKKWLSLKNWILQYPKINDDCLDKLWFEKDSENLWHNFHLITDEIWTWKLFIDRHLDELWVKNNIWITEIVKVFDEFIETLQNDVFDNYTAFLNFNLNWSIFNRRLSLDFDKLSKSQFWIPSIWIIDNNHIHSISWWWEFYIREIFSKKFERYYIYYTCFRSNESFKNNWNMDFSQDITMYFNPQKPKLQ